MLLTMPIKKFLGLIYKIINLPCHLTQRKGQITLFYFTFFRGATLFGFPEEKLGRGLSLGFFRIVGIFRQKRGVSECPHPINFVELLPALQNLSVTSKFTLV